MCGSPLAVGPYNVKFVSVYDADVIAILNVNAKRI